MRNFRESERDLPLTVHVMRSAAFLSLFAGVIMLVAGNAQLGVAIILLAALYIGLAEVINHLAVIARYSRMAQALFDEEPDDDEPCENFETEEALR